jgi:hypothetical protein
MPDDQERLATCPNCQVVLHTTRKVIQLGQAQLRVALPPSRRARLYTRLHRAFLAREH